MSELARNEYGEEWTAFSLKDEYLSNGTEFKWFVCAYCDTAVSPAATYGNDYKKAPYFTLADHSKPHALECPYGESTFAAHGVTREIQAPHEFDVALPERLVPIRTQRVSATPDTNPPKDLASPAEIHRRVRAGATVAAITNQYTTGLLKTLVDARFSAMRAIRELPRVTALTAEKERVKLVFKTLEACPLNLYGRQLNYSSAFHKANHTPWEGPYIYMGTATATEVPGGFLLTATDTIPGSVEDERVPVHIRVMCDKNAPVNLMEQRTTERLAAAVSAETPVRWFVYGELKMNNSLSAYEIVVQHPYHIHT